MILPFASVLLLLHISLCYGAPVEVQPKEGEIDGSLKEPNGIRAMMSLLKPDQSKVSMASGETANSIFIRVAGLYLEKLRRGEASLDETSMVANLLSLAADSADPNVVFGPGLDFVEAFLHRLREDPDYIPPSRYALSDLLSDLLRALKLIRLGLAEGKAGVEAANSIFIEVAGLYREKLRQGEASLEEIWAAVNLLSQVAASRDTNVVFGPGLDLIEAVFQHLREDFIPQNRHVLDDFLAHLGPVRKALAEGKAEEAKVMITLALIGFQERVSALEAQTSAAQASDPLA